jgi:tRNA threonylcarbamoyladenosine biosynthesis protein TsaE
LSVLTTHSLTSHSLEQTTELGVRLGEPLAGGDVICLSGELGAGKTALAAGIGKGWGARETINSPTFVFVHEHRRTADDLVLFHVDCYRLANFDDAESIGIEDILAGDGVAVIEWPERIEALLPTERLWITLETPGDGEAETERQITLEATGARYIGILEAVFRES